MEWGRAKTILILTFLLLNVLLGYQLWKNKINLAGEYFHSRELTQQTEQLLKSKGISLAQEIPKQTPLLSEITVKYDRTYHQDDIVPLPEAIPTQTVLYEQSIRQPLSDYIARTNEYQYDRVLSSKGVYVYNQIYEDIPLFGVPLTFYTKDGRVTSYQQSYVQTESIAEAEKQRVLSAHMAVRFLAENVLDAGAVIEDIRLGYHGMIYDAEPLLLFPKWRISILNGNIYYIHAMNGALEEVERTAR